VLFARNSMAANFGVVASSKSAILIFRGMSNSNTRFSDQTKGLIVQQNFGRLIVNCEEVSLPYLYNSSTVHTLLSFASAYSLFVYPYYKVEAQ